MSIKISGFITAILFTLVQTTFAPALAFSPYSNDELDQLEKEFVAEINHSEQVIKDPLINQYLSHLGQKLSAQTDVLPKPTFFMVKSNEINAFAGPGGHIGINSMLFLISEHENELAAVMAHEIAHVRQNHLYHMLEHHHHMQVPMLASLLASIALGIINPALGQGALMATLGGFAQDNINFIRSNEKEADRIGMEILKRADFNPRGMSQFFKRMQESSRYYSAKIPEILRTHPLDDNRIAEAENRIENSPKDYQPDSLAYQLTKERIRNLTTKNPRQLVDLYNAGCSSPETTDNACLYGKALTHLRMNQPKEAIKILTPLHVQDHENLFYAISLSEAESKLGEHDKATARLENLYENHPENYAVMMALAQEYTQADALDKAAYALLQAHRSYPKDLSVCRKLARAQSDIHQKAYAYFTLAECYALEGNKKEAKRLLKLAKTLVKKDKFLSARIDAKLDELVKTF